MPYESLYIDSNFWHDQTSSRYVWKLLSNDLYFDSFDNFELQSTQIGHTSQYNCHHDKIILLAFCTFRLLTYAWDHPVSKYHHDSTLRAAMTIFVVESPVAFMQMFYSWDFSSISCKTYREAIGKTRLVWDMGQKHGLLNIDK